MRNPKLFLLNHRPPLVHKVLRDEQGAASFLPILQMSK